MRAMDRDLDRERPPTRFRVDAAFAGYRLDQFLQRMIPRLSRNRVQRAIAERVRLSWEAPVKASTPVREGEIVFVHDPEVREEVVEFDPRVLYEDRDLLAIDKPPGLVVHPTHSHLRNTVITLLRRHRDEPDLTLAHRLDAETSGVLLLGRHRWAARKVQTAFERGRVAKSYLALVAGNPGEDTFEVDTPLAAASDDSFVYRQRPDAEARRPAQTRFAVVERLASCALVRAEPSTGRRHQIRAHLALAGYPILGDKLYRLDDRDYRRYLRQGALDEQHRALLEADRLMLHSAALELPAPRDRERSIRIEAPLPEDMRRLLEERR
jgi:23S rRNA pseudouridine1911/1915/1917 synthase